MAQVSVNGVDMGPGTPLHVNVDEDTVWVGKTGETPFIDAIPVKKSELVKYLEAGYQEV